MPDSAFTPPKSPLKVVITGSRGLVGSELVPRLAADGHAITRFVTGKAEPNDDGTKWVKWDPDAKPDAAALYGIDAVIHLAGESVASGRWTAEKKRAILESRVGPTRKLALAAAALPPERRPKTFICASAVGFYGDRGDEVLTEDSAPGSAGFFPEVCKAWEEATAPARDEGIRTANLRIGVVLSPKGGALGKQLLAFKLGAGAVLGSGKQWVPWITVGDTARAIRHCLATGAVRGPVNLVAPNPVTNRAFAKILGRVLSRPAFFWLPRFALRIMFGEIADNALLASMKAIPKKLLDTGFAFDQTELEPALRSLLGRV